MTRSAPRSPLGGLRFRHSWREYQTRVLAALDRHLEDNRLHLVAPPGSGKTVVGLEVIRRRAVNAVVLTPTITVREQWLQRLAEDFASAVPVAVSRDPGRPAELTVCTYQALHQRWKAAPDLDVVLARAGVRTLVADEAHHLRRAWWRSLEALQSGLQAKGELTVVALTATPPYDAPAVEWNRYRRFCGPVDEEIAVPELVAAADLCPHQDLVYLVEPDAAEAARLRRFQEGADALVRDLAFDLELARALADDPRVRAPAQSIEGLLESSDAFLAATVFLASLRWEAARPLILELGLDGVPLPRLDRTWAEALLQAVIVGALKVEPAISDRWRRRLSELGALEHGQVRLGTSPRELRRLRSSPAKVNGVCRIVELESRLDPLELRLVVLTDHVRSAALGAAGGARLGAVPVFEAIRRRRLAGVRPGVLTGRLVVLPGEAAEAFDRVAARCGAGGGSTWVPLAHDPCFVRLDRGADHTTTRVVTELFAAGQVNVLVGTAALLGEGWDAPALSTLVLATAIGTHVMSNQMRGRAIRVQPGRPGKAANIWHLACCEPASAPRPAGDESRNDLALLGQRFRAFVGPAADRDALESGIGRLGVAADRSLSRAELERVNRDMCAAAEGREALAGRWARCLDRGPGRSGELRPEVLLPPGAWAPALAVRATGDGRGIVGRLCEWLARRRLLRIGRAVVEVLEEQGALTSGGRPVVELDRARGSLSLGLQGASYADRSRFVALVGEVFDCLASPRYLLRRRDRYWAVPIVLGLNRRLAERFARAWRRHVGRARLVYTRSSDGRRHLLRAKQASLLRADPLRVATRMRWTAGAPSQERVPPT